MNVPIVERQRTLMKGLLADVEGRTFLEVGCGDGRNLEVLAEMGWTGTGIDLSGDAVHYALHDRELCDMVDVVRGDFMVFDLGQADLVCCLFVLEHLREDFRALERLHSLTCKGGHLLLSVPAHESMFSHQDKIAGHFRRYDREAIVKMIEEAGFRVKEIMCFGYPVANAYIKAYNTLLYFRSGNNGWHTEKTGIMEETAHIPQPFRFMSSLAFPVLSELIKMDRFTLDKDLGTHYIILAKKKP